MTKVEKQIRTAIEKKFGEPDDLYQSLFDTGIKPVRPSSIDAVFHVVDEYLREIQFSK